MPFLDVDDVYVLPGGSQPNDFFIEAACTVTAGVVTVEAFDLYTTLDAQIATPQSIQTYARFYSGNTPKDWLWTQWFIPSEAEYPGGVITFPQLVIENKGNQVINPPVVYWTSAQVKSYFNTLTTNNNASALVKGITKLSVAPASATNPIAYGINDPHLPTVTTPVYWASQYASYAAAVTAAGVTSGTLIISEAMSTTTGSASTTLNHLFIGSGRLNTSVANTTIAGSILAPPNKQIFGGSGSFVLSGTNSWIETSWWGNTDLGTELAKAWAAIVAVGGKIMLPHGASTLSTSANCTNAHAQSITISGFGRGSTIDAQLSGGVAFDFTGTQFLILEDFLVSGNSTFTPDVCFLFARISPGADNSAGINHMYNVETIGKWGFAPLYNYGSEEFRAYDCHFDNFGNGAHAAIFTGDNNFGVTSLYQTISTGAVSNIDFALFGCAFEAFGTGDSDCLYLRGVEGFSAYGSFLVTNARSFVHVDADGLPSVNIDLKDTRFDTVGSSTADPVIVATYGVLQTGTAQVAYVTIEQTFDQGVLNPMAGGAYTTISNAATCAITTTLDHNLATGQTIIIRGALSTLGTAINGPRVVTVTGAKTFTIPVNTTATSVYGGTGASGGGRSYYVTGLGQNLELRINQYLGASGTGNPFVYVFSADQCYIDVAPGGVFECAGDLINSEIKIGVGSYFLARPDQQSNNNVSFRGVGYSVSGLFIQGEGPDLTISANTIAPTFSIHGVGAGLIKTITVPAAFMQGFGGGAGGTGGSIDLIPTAAFTYDATGNILSAGGTNTATVGRTMRATYRPSTGKFSMSY